MKLAKDVLGETPDATPIWTAADGRRFAVLDSVCDDPECRECNVLVSLCPLDDPSCQLKLRLDLLKGRVSAEERMEEADWAAASEFAKAPGNLEMIERRRQLVRAWCLVESGRRLRADDGRTYAIEEFSPIGEQFILPFKFGGDRWFVVDSYCANSDCPCTEAHVPLYRIRPERKRQDAEFAVALDLETGEVRQEEDETFPPDWMDVVRAFQDSLGDWRTELSRRRGALRAIAAKRLRRRAAEAAPVAESPVAVAQSQPADAPTGSPSVGVPSPTAGGGVSRNAPCPCGSGKKYKRCCGA